MRFVGVLVVGHYPGCKVLIPGAVPRVGPISSSVSSEEKPPVAKLIPAGVIRVSLGPGDHQQTQATPQ